VHWTALFIIVITHCCPWLLFVPGKLDGHADGQNYVTFGEVLIKFDRGISIVIIGHCNDVSKFVICYINQNEAKLGAGMEASVPSE
jgi:hypothetical protein